MLNFQNWLIKESFDTVSDFLLNPEHRNKNWSELMKEFEDSGGEVIGVGKYGKVFSHPSWSYVLKMYQDEFYTRFVRFAYRNQHSSFPKFYGPPQRIIPFYRRYASNSIAYVVRMEKLYELPKETYKTIDDWLYRGISYIEAIKRGTANTEVEDWHYPNSKERREGKKPELKKSFSYQDIMDILKQYPKLFNVFEGLHMIIEAKLIGSLDMHRDNFMQRANGDIVIVDPLWGGTTPYADHKRMMDMETDNIPYDYEEEPNIIGGKLPKKPRKKQVKPISQNIKDDTPF